MVFTGLTSFKFEILENMTTLDQRIHAGLNFSYALSGGSKPLSTAQKKTVSSNSNRSNDKNYQSSQR